MFSIVRLRESFSTITRHHLILSANNRNKTKRTQLKTRTPMPLRSRRHIGF